MVESGIEEKLKSACVGDLRHMAISDSAELKIYAFNVGQANFIVLRKDRNAVIIDASIQQGKGGMPDSEYIPGGDLLDMVLNGCQIQAVYLTHPHKDHYSFLFDVGSATGLIPGLITRYNFSAARFILGGALEDWSNTPMLQLPQKQIFLNNNFDRRVFLDGVDFKVFGTSALPVHRKGEKNKLSLLIQVSYAGKQALFLGDAEGDSIGRLFHKSADLRAVKFLVSPGVQPEIDDVAGKLDEFVGRYSTDFNDELFASPEFAAFAEEYHSVYASVREETGCIPSIEYIVGADIAKEKAIDAHINFAKIIPDLATSSPEAADIFIDEVMEFVDDILHRNWGKNQEFLVQFLEKYEIPYYTMRRIKNLLHKHVGAELHNPFIEYFGPFIQEIQDHSLANQDFLPKFRAYFFTEAEPEETDHILVVKQLVKTLATRQLFKDSHIIFLPHHGTNTKSSQNFLGLFAGLPTPHFFVVSSSPFGNDQLPKASTLEMAPFGPKFPAHPFLYCRDFLSSRGEPQLIMTEKPIYMTGAAPAGVITTVIKEDGNALFLDLTSTESPWINVLDGV